MLNNRQKYFTIQNVFLAILTVLALQACSVTPYEHGFLEDHDVVARAVTQELGDYSVRAAVPTREEAQQIFGIPVYKRGIQPVWLEVTNDGNERARFVISSMDPEYFSPYEVAYMHKKYYSKQGWKDMEAFLYRNAMPRMIGAGDTESGFVFTHASTGTKSFNVVIFSASENARYEEFTYFIEVPGFVPDHAEVDFKELYALEDVRDHDRDGLRVELESTPCCSTSRDGQGQGQPLNIVLVAHGRDLLQALLRADWSETSYEKDDIYLNNSNYLFSRPPDAVFRKARGKTTERNELSLWLAPYRVENTPVWIAQMKHAIGRRYQIEEFFLGSAQDPDVDDGRNFLLQNLWYSQSLKYFAYSASGIPVPAESPVVDFNNNPFFTDGVRIVMWVSGDPVALNDVRLIDLLGNSDEQDE